MGPATRPRQLVVAPEGLDTALEAKLLTRTAGGILRYVLRQLAG